MDFAATQRVPVIEFPDDLVVEALRRQSPMESVARMNDGNNTARLLLAAGIRLQQPTWPEQQISAEVARRMLDAAS